MTAPIQEPTQARVDQGQEYRTRQLFRRPAPLPATPGSGGYLQPLGVKYAGNDFQVLTSLNAYLGGNDTSWYDGSWQWIQDSDSPYEGMAIESAIIGDWFPFPVGNVGPQGTGWAVAIWFAGDPDHGGKCEIEWATVSVDEAGNTSGPTGSDTSVLSGNDFEFWDATPPSWYNTANTSDLSHTYRFDTSDAALGWGGTNVLIERSPFVVAGADGTPLTANAGASSTFEWNREFNGGGGPDLWWWMRIRITGNGAGSDAANVRLGKIWVYRFNGSSNFVGG